MGKKSRSEGSFFQGIKHFLKYVLEVFTVSKCPSCQKLVRYTGTLCPDCSAEYKKEKEGLCKYCHLPAVDCVCSTRGLKFSRPMGKSLHSYMFYDRSFSVFQNILYRLKRDSDRSCEIFFARELSSEIMKLAAQKRQHLSDWCITFPPRTRKARLKYGFDQSEGMAKRIAAYTGMKYENVFGRLKKSDATQKDLIGAAHRDKNAKKSFYLKRKADVKGKKYIIVDDIITSGSTVRQCEKLLLAAGAKTVFPVSMAKTYYRGAGFDRPAARRKRPDTTWFME